MTAQYEKAQSNAPNELSGSFSDESGFEGMGDSPRLTSAEKQYSKSHTPLLDMSQYGLPDAFGESLDDPYLLGNTRTFDAPRPRPGYAQRWVRFELNGKRDIKNITRKIRGQGWRPRRASTVTGPVSVPTVAVDGGDAILMVDGYVLCEMPEVHAEKLRRAYEEATNRQNIAVRSDFEGSGRSDNTAVSYESKEAVTLGMRPRTVEAAGNENR